MHPHPPPQPTQQQTQQVLHQTQLAQAQEATILAGAPLSLPAGLDPMFASASSSGPKQALPVGSGYSGGGLKSFQSMLMLPKSLFGRFRPVKAGQKPATSAVQQFNWLQGEELRRPPLTHFRGFGSLPGAPLELDSNEFGPQRPLPGMPLFQANYFKPPHIIQETEEEPKKHALGFGESDDFQIMEAPARPPEEQRAKEDEMQAEMPAILITDNESEPGQAQEAPNATSISVSNTTSVENSDFSSPAPLVQQQEVESIQIGNETLGDKQTNTSSSDFPGQESTGVPVRLAEETASPNFNLSAEITNSDANNNFTDGANILTTLISDELLKLKKEPEMLNKTFSSMTQPPANLFSGDQSARGANETLVDSAGAPQSAIENQEKGGQESSAGPSFAALPPLSSSEEALQPFNDANQNNEPVGQFESFIIGPYKGLTSDNLLPANSQHHFKHSEDNSLSQFSPVEMGRQPKLQQQGAFVGLGGVASNFFQQAKNLIHLPFVHMVGQQQQANLLMPMQAVGQQDQFGLTKVQEQLMKRPSSLSAIHNSGAPPAPIMFPRPQDSFSANRLLGQHSQPPARLHLSNLGPSQPNRNRYFMPLQQQQLVMTNNFRPAHSGNFGDVMQQQRQQFPYRAEGVPARPQGELRSHPINNLAMEQQQQQSQAYGFNMVVNHKNNLHSTSGELAQTSSPGPEVLVPNKPAKLEKSRFKSGLYQIEPPKLVGSSEKQPAGFATDEQQEQKFVTAADEQQQELPANSLEQQIKEEASEVDAEEEEDEKDLEQAAARRPEEEKSFASKQVGASIGFEGNQGQQPNPRGQVFSEPISSVLLNSKPAFRQFSGSDQDDGQSTNQMKSLKMTQDVTLYDFELPAGGRQLESTSWPTSSVTEGGSFGAASASHKPYNLDKGALLDTQVFTVPYTLSMQPNGRALFTAESGNARQQQGPQQGQRDFRAPSPSAAGFDPRQQSQRPLPHSPQPPRLSQAHQAREGQPLRPFFPQTPTNGWHSGPQPSRLATLHAPAGLSQPQPMNLIRQPPRFQNNLYMQYQQVGGQARSPASSHAEVQPMYEFGAQTETRQPEQQQHYVLAIQHDPTNLLSGGSGNGGAVVFGQQQAFIPGSEQMFTAAPVSMQKDTRTMITTQAAPTEPETHSAPDTDHKVPVTTQVSMILPRPEAALNEDQEGKRESLSAIQTQQTPLASARDSQQQPRSPSSFCAGREPGLYADESQRCKAYYQCAPTGHQMFRCNNQTQFNQKTQNCDWWYNVNCGGQLGSSADFEASSSTATPASAGADQSERSDQPEALQEPQVNKQQESEPLEMFHHSDSQANVTVAPPEGAGEQASLEAIQAGHQLQMPSSTQAYRESQFAERSSTTQDPMLAASSTLDTLQQSVELAASISPQPEAQPQVGENLKDSEDSAVSTTTPTREAQSSSTASSQSSSEPSSTSAAETKQTQPTNAPEASPKKLIQSEFGRGAQKQESSGKSARSSSAKYSLFWSRQHPNHKYANESAVYSAASQGPSVSYTPGEELEASHLIAKGLEEQREARREHDNSEVKTEEETSTGSPSNSNKPPGKMERRYGTRLLKPNRTSPNVQSTNSG